MYDTFFSNTGAEFQQLFAPLQKLNGLMVDQIAKVTEFQLAATRSYADMGVEQLRAVAGIQDTGSLQAFVEQQGKVVQTLNEKLRDDTTTIAALGKDFTAELQKLAQESVAGASKASRAA